MMKRLLLAFVLLGLFAAALPAYAGSSPLHKTHKVKRHKGVKHHS